MPNLISVSRLELGGQLVDVRTPSEFSTGHIAGAVNIPLDQIESRVDDLDPNSPLVLVCKAGTRACIAADLLAPCRPNTSVLEGGMDAWLHAGRPVVVTSRTRWSLERQVRLIAGLLVLAGAVAALTLHPRWIFLSAFVGLGLTFAGLTDICAMGALLSRMPWNQNVRLEAIRDTAGQSCALKH
jgi:rhodanese-related sulfurtransferase